MGAVGQLAIEAFAAGLVGLFSIIWCAGRARDCSSALRALLAVCYAPICRVVAEGADLFLISIDCGEVSACACIFSDALPESAGRVRDL